MTNKVYFNTPDNLKLCGVWSTPNKKTEKAIVLAHGLNADKNEGGEFVRLADELTGKGFSVLRFDFRGRGESGGQAHDISTNNEITDLQAAIKFVQKKDSKSIGLLGASYGGASSIIYAANNPNRIKCLCLWNPGLDTRSVIIKIALQEVLKKIESLLNGNFKNLKRGKNSIFSKGILKELFTVSPYKFLNKIEVPTLIIHGDRDSKVPYEDSEKYVKLLKNGELFTVKNGQHGFHREDESKIAIGKTVSFFKKHLNG